MDHILNRFISFEIPPGKSRSLRKTLKRINKQRKKAGLKKLKATKLKLHKVKVEDALGYIVPQDCDMGPWVTPRSFYDVAETLKSFDGGFFAINDE